MGMAQGRVATKNSVRKYLTRKETTRAPKIKMGRQDKRGRAKSKARRGLEINCIRKRKLEQICWMVWSEKPCLSVLN